MWFGIVLGVYMIFSFKICKITCSKMHKILRKFFLKKKVWTKRKRQCVHKIIYAIYGCLLCLIIWSGIISIKTYAEKRNREEINEYIPEIIVTCSKLGMVEKTIEDIFFDDDVSSVADLDVVSDDYKKMLHFDWYYEGICYIEYGKNMAEIYNVDSTEEDEHFEDLSKDEQKKVEEYAQEIASYQIKKISGEQLTPEECWAEYEAYFQSYQIRPTAEMKYQCGRTMEDLFWMDSDTEILEPAAKSIVAFEEFMTYENHEVGESPENRDVERDEIIFRSGKMYYRLAQKYQHESELKKHFLFCAYGCFANMDLVNTSDNRWSLQGAYYKGLTIGFMDLEDIDEELMKEFGDTCDKAEQLFQEKENGTRSDLEVETEMGEKLQDLKWKLELKKSEVDQWINRYK